jgi:hypothetical protein
MADEPDRPQAIASEAEIDALEYVVHQGIIGAYDRPVLLAWLARLQRTPSEPSTPGEGTSQRECAEPVAWAVMGDGYEYVSMMPEMCGAWASENGGRTVPLYRSPTLTDAERFVLREVMDIYAGEDDVASNEIAAVIDGLLARTR